MKSQHGGSLDSHLSCLGKAFLFSATVYPGRGYSAWKEFSGYQGKGWRTRSAGEAETSKELGEMALGGGGRQHLGCDRFQELGDLGLLPILKIEKPRLKVKQLP